MYAIELLAAYFVIAYLAIFLVVVALLSRSTRKWQEVGATLLDVATVERKNVQGNSGIAGPIPGVDRISYSYIWEGKKYVGTQCYVLGIKPFPGLSTQRFIREIQSAARSHRLKVYVNPGDPSNAVLKREVPGAAFVLGIIVVLVGGVLILFGNFVHPELLEKNFGFLIVGLLAGALATIATIRIARRR